MTNDIANKFPYQIPTESVTGPVVYVGTSFIALCNLGVAKNWKQTATSGGSFPHSISTISIEMVYGACEKVCLTHYVNQTPCTA
jgi:hypothetical protein